MNHILQELRIFYQEMGTSELFRAIRPNVCTKDTKMTSDRKHPLMKDVNMGCLGVSRAYHRSAFTSSRLVRTPAGQRLARVLCTAIRKKYPKFQFNCIQVNRQFPGNYHVDKKNYGPSVGLFVGATGLRGGELYVYNRKKKQGKLYKTKNKWVPFDGNDPHFTAPYKGERYSMIFFRTKGVDQVEKEAKKFLKKLGFPLKKVGTFKPTRVQEDMADGLEYMQAHYPTLYKHYLKLNRGKGTTWGFTGGKFHGSHTRIGYYRKHKQYLKSKKKKKINK